ncbi:TupA-like ATPgrasp [Ruminococcus sp. YRD2003]|uniref:ATP-grasp fold amidoligase family protein n=1 Tax=Ruminococcus sp. YRD2003 TaxID=1452313 RepID=UPI0008AB1D0B|nr:TupA-like ATPgrasp [Ruminococcus flavefaciens]
MIGIIKVFNVLKDKNKRFLFLAQRGYYNKMGDRDYIERLYEAKFGKRINLDSPQTYNEKLQWLKLFDRRPEYTTMVDKYAVKEYVAQRIGEKYIIPTLGVWERFEDINFEKLPNKFVLKCTHDSGGLVICKDKSNFDIDAAKAKINRSLKKNYYLLWREWPYKNVKPRIIAEKYMEDSEPSCKGRPINDYKIYTFGGVAKMMMINSDRGISTRADYFDREFNWLDFTWGYAHADKTPAKPQNYEKMFELAERLAEGTPELRVDFYEVDGKVYFGELTFFDGSGLDRIKPFEWDLKMGEWVTLPGKRA